MPSSRSRPPAPPARRSRPALGRGFAPAPVPPRRPQTVPFAAVFAGLVAAEDLYLGWLLWEPLPGQPDVPGVHRYVLVAVALALWAVAGGVLVWRGAARGWLVLAGAAVVPLLLLLFLAVLFAALGGGQAAWWAILLLAGPVGCLVLACGRPVREWTRPGRATPPPGRRRSGGPGR
ncbi:hypothetical protein [Blastococcus sp. SYSU D00820]